MSCLGNSASPALIRSPGGPQAVHRGADTEVGAAAPQGQPSSRSLVVPAYQVLFDHIPLS